MITPEPPRPIDPAGPGSLPDLEQRRRELELNLSAVHDRIERACHDAGRTDELTLVVVTKFFPASDVDLLAGLGVTDIGENRDQEASAKLESVAHRSGCLLYTSRCV